MSCRHPTRRLLAVALALFVVPPALAVKPVGSRAGTGGPRADRPSVLARVDDDPVVARVPWRLSVGLSTEQVWVRLHADVFPALLQRVDWSALDGDGSGQLEGREVGAAVELVRLLVVAELGVTVGERPVLLGRAPARRDGPAGEPLGLLDPVALTVEASLPAPPFWDHLDLAVRHLPAEPGVVVPVSLRWGEGLTVDGLSAHRAERRGAGRVEAVMTWSQPWLRATVRRLEVGSAPAPQPVAKP